MAEPELELSFPDRAAWRAWLASHHATVERIWLVFHKVGSGTPSVGYTEAVQEALCFGWIDAKVQRLDEKRYRQVFTRRKPNSVWSKVNKGYLLELQAQGLMHEAGLRAVEVAKSNGSWSSLDDVENGVVPPDLEAALEADPAARAGFEAWSPSARKSAFYRLRDAKRPATRQARIAEILEAARTRKGLA